MAVPNTWPARPILTTRVHYGQTLCPGPAVTRGCPLFLLGMRAELTDHPGSDHGGGKSPEESPPVARARPRPLLNRTQSLTPVAEHCSECQHTLWAGYYNVRTVTALD